MTSSPERSGSPKQPPRRFGWFARCLLACVSLIAGLKVGDVLLGSICQVRQRHLLRLAPNCRLQHRSREFDYVYRTNSLGFRGPDLPFQKPAGTRRVVVIGDSFVAGHGVADEQMLTTRLQEALHATASSGAGRVEVVNLGRSGTGTIRELDLYEWYGRRFEPDVVVLVYHPGNDLSEVLREQTRAELDAWHPTGLVRRSAYALFPNCYLQLALLRLSQRQRDEMSPRSEVQQEDDVRSAAVALGRDPAAALARFRALPAAIRSDVAAGHLSVRRIIDACVAPDSLMQAIEPAESEFRTAWARTEAHLNLLLQKVTGDGARLAVVVVPASFQVDPECLQFQRELGFEVRDAWLTGRPRAVDALSRWAAQSGVPVCDLTDDLRGAGESMYFVEDGHFAPAGHTRAAEWIAAFLARQQLIP